MLVIGVPGEEGAQGAGRAARVGLVMSSEYWVNRALERLQAVARETVRLSEQAADEDERFMALIYAMTKARQVVERLASRGETDAEGRLASVAAAVGWWEATTPADQSPGGAAAVAAANDRMKEAVGIIGLATSDDPELWARAGAWASSHAAAT